MPNPVEHQLRCQRENVIEFKVRCALSLSLPLTECVLLCLTALLTFLFLLFSLSVSFTLSLSVSLTHTVSYCNSPPNFHFFPSTSASFSSSFALSPAYFYPCLFSFCSIDYICSVYGTNYNNIMALLWLLRYIFIFYGSLPSPFAFLRLHLQLSLNQTQQNKL